MKGFTYSTDAKYGGHIVAEAFEYTGRDEEEKELVKFCELRQEFRAGIKDKSWNPLITVPASPGSGKSTFLVHFPQSRHFQNYCNGLSPIVCTLTFNYEMQYADDILGLRIIYGTLRSMRMLEGTII